MYRQEILELMYIVPAAIIAITLHELAHGYISVKLGDNTPLLQGRLTLNPLKHLDPFGTIALLVFGFGWAKPIEVNPYYYKNKKLGMLLVALAGPVTNMIIAFISYFIVGVIIKLEVSPFNGIAVYLMNLARYCAVLNISLGIFNLIPIPPLDGSKILLAVFPQKIYFSILKYEKYIYFVLIVLLFFGVFQLPLNFLRNGISNAMATVVEMVLQI